VLVRAVLVAGVDGARDKGAQAGHQQQRLLAGQRLAVPRGLAQAVVLRYGEGWGGRVGGWGGSLIERRGRVATGEGGMAHNLCPEA
jgi:hypothetical protein